MLGSNNEAGELTRMVKARLLPASAVLVEADELQLAFTPVDLDGVLHEWTFGDETPPSNLSNPTHQYNLPGDYEVCLTITDDCQTTTSCQQIAVRCSPPIPDFILEAIELDVRFTDTSLGGPTEWTWLLGDGNQSNDSTFIHSYN